MSDVHGRKREKTTEELVQARKTREASKIKEYNGLVEDCRIKMELEEYDIDTFNLTTKILQWNPDYYTIWNYRRVLILDFISKDSAGLDYKQKTFVNELLFFLQLIKINPKSYWLWNHRIWCLETMLNADWRAELDLVDKMLTLDARNFHGWNYRRYVVSHLKQVAESEVEISKVIIREYEFTTRKINQSFSNYSAWHQRSKLLPHIVTSMSVGERNALAKNELELVKAAIYTDPEDQSAWLYYWWLLGRAPEEVQFLNAYQLVDSSLVILGFNDDIKFMQVPEIYNKDNEPLSGELYSLCDGDESSSVWVYSLDNTTASTAAYVHIQSDIVVPSNSAKSVSKDKKWVLDVQQIAKEEGVFERNELLKKNLKNPWRPSSTKMYEDPTLNDQTAWFTLDKIQLLKDEIEAVRELLELEPDSAWTLQTLAHFLSQLVLRASQTVDVNSINSEIISILDKLIEIDCDRECRYKDKKTVILFDQKISALKEDQILDLSDLPSNYIPLLSKLLLVKNVTVSSSKLQVELNKLPFLNKCALQAHQ